MKREYLICETFFKEDKQNFYWLSLPNVGEDGFYRSAVSFNSFFNSTRNPHSNVTQMRQFTHDHKSHIGLKNGLLAFREVDLNKIQYFDSIWDFYKFIGYDYKKRKYSSGEKMKTFKDGQFI